MSTDLGFGLGAAIIVVGSCLMAAGLLRLRTRHRAALRDTKNHPES